MYSKNCCILNWVSKTLLTSQLKQNSHHFSPKTIAFQIWWRNSSNQNPSPNIAKVCYSLQHSKLDARETHPRQLFDKTNFSTPAYTTQNPNANQPKYSYPLRHFIKGIQIIHKNKHPQRQPHFPPQKSNAKPLKQNKKNPSPPLS